MATRSTLCSGRSSGCVSGGDAGCELAAAGSGGPNGSELAVDSIGSATAALFEISTGSGASLLAFLTVGFVARVVVARGFDVPGSEVFGFVARVPAPDLVARGGHRPP